MRKTIFLLLVLFSSSLYSQNLITNKGESILPEQDDWSIGTSAHPLSNYIFNLFTGSSIRNDSMPSFGDHMYLSVKKFISNKQAIRYTIGANFDMKQETWSVGLGYGVENRKGNTRLQGLWGYHGFIGIGEFLNNHSSNSLLNYENGYNMHLVANLFVGCEYFVFAKIAIGAEYHYGATMHITDSKTNFIIGNNSNSTVMKINYYF